MPGTREALIAIVEKCLAMDHVAVSVYRAMSENSADPAIAAFWREMSDEEKEHTEAWSALLALMFDREFPSLFPDPQQTLLELTAQHEQVRAASADFHVFKELPAQFLAAFRLEFYMLHPALERLWRYYELLSDRNPALEYENHLRKFVNAVERWGAASPELQLLGAAILRLWAQLRELAHEAAVDVVTRVLNRRGLFTNMKMLAYLSRRNEFTAGALMIDIDNFKLINDTHGHQTGDEVLANVARLISEAVRNSDLVGRYGGEEFLVFLPQIDRSALTVLGEKVRRAVEEGTRMRIPATVSIGAACTRFSEGIEPDIDSLIKAADGQLYLAKSAGRNSVAATSSC